MHEIMMSCRCAGIELLTTLLRVHSRANTAIEGIASTDGIWCTVIELHASWFNIPVTKHRLCSNIDAKKYLFTRYIGFANTMVWVVVRWCLLAPQYQWNYGTWTYVYVYGTSQTKPKQSHATLTHAHYTHTHTEHKKRIKTGQKTTIVHVIKHQNIHEHVHVHVLPTNDYRIYTYMIQSKNRDPLREFTVAKQNGAGKLIKGGRKDWTKETC